jgi:hypothetical protein
MNIPIPTTMINAVVNKRRLNRNCELDLITIGKMPAVEIAL